MPDDKPFVHDATCSTVWIDDTCRCRHDKPPDRAEWERPWEHPERGAWEPDDATLDKMHYRDCHCKSRGFFQCQKARYRIRAAVQRALNEREAATWRDAADNIHRCHYENEIAPHSGWDAHQTDTLSEAGHDMRLSLLRQAAAAEARARKP